MGHGAQKCSTKVKIMSPKSRDFDSPRGPKMIENSENNESQIEGMLLAKGSKNDRKIYMLEPLLGPVMTGVLVQKELTAYRLKPSWCQISMVFWVQGGLEKVGFVSILAISPRG